MHRSFLIFATAFIALMAGALFYAARLPVEAPQSAPAATTTDASALEQAAAAATAQAPSGPVYPEFILPDLGGDERSIAEWDGKYRILNFWATWCAPCRREIPLLIDLQARHGDDGIQVIGIAVEESVEDVIAYAESANFNYPNLVGFEKAMQAAESSGVEMIGMPFTMIIADDGELLNVHMGEIHQSDLDHIVAVLAQLDTGAIDKLAARDSLNSL